MTKEERLDLIEQHVLPILDNLWEEHQDVSKCVLPDWISILLDLKGPVSNQNYDMLRNELFAERPEADVFNKASAANLEITQNKFVHEPPMTSISKASHQDRSIQEEQLFHWMGKCVNASPEAQKSWHIKEDVFFNDKPLTYPENFFYQAFKLDGVALALYYNEKGELVKAGLRPRDGKEGEDVTKNVKFIEGVPLKLNKPIACSPRGEVICKLSDFAEVQKELAAEDEDLRANPRNHASGGIRQFKNPDKTKKMRLTFIAYTVEGIEDPPWKTEIQRAKYCNQILGLPFVQVKPFHYKDLEKMEGIAKNELDYQTDGVIVGINNLSLQEELGRHGDQKTGNPKGKIAWKFEEERAAPVIKNIVLQTGRSGSITPVAEFDAVDLGGTKVSRATLHNIGFMIRKKIGIGTKITVIKAGNIIPKVVGVVSGYFDWVDIICCQKGMAIEQGKFWREGVWLQECPSCHCKSHIIFTEGKNNDDMYELFCGNKECPAQNVGTLLHYLKIFGVLGLGESKVRQLMEAGLIKYPAHFYKLTEKDCLSAGMSERQALLALASIHMVASPEKMKNDKLRLIVQKAQASKKNVPLWKLFASFGIDMAGKSCGKALADNFNGSFEAIRDASIEDLSEVKDVGEKTATIVHAYLKEHEEQIEELLKYVYVNKPVTGVLSGKSFCLSGGFEGSKRKWEDKIEKLGGKITSVSKNLNYLVQGSDPGADKEEKAKKVQVPVIGIEELKKILGES